MQRQLAAILGSGNIGTDLLVKMQERSLVLEPLLLVGIDPDSDGLRRAERRGVATTSAGIEGLLAHPRFDDIAVVFDATSAKAHLHHAEVLAARGKRMVDMTPAAKGPYVVPVANLDEHLQAPNVNMVTCGGQATIPIVWALSRHSKVRYAEIVASIASRSAGPGTRANIDEFTETTARGLEVVGGAEVGKAIIVLNPAEPPLIMRDTVYALVEGSDDETLTGAIEDVVASVQRYVPGYRLKAPPVFERFERGGVFMPGRGLVEGRKVTVLLEVEGAGDYLPRYAGNLDIMTSAAMAVGERLVGVAS
ncbi:MAG: acetaldehyde dehydrogenase (acetylating) [Myxococcota bacterium]